ncbi:hypothetical protein AG4045_002166, partial [Apium graveolens]
MALTCSDDYRHFAVTKGHGVKGISDLGLNALPEQHVQPPEERIDIRKVLSKETIPVIDINEVLEFMKKSEFVIKWVLKALMQRLKVEIDSRESLLMGSKRINLNYYPICPNPELAVGVSRHSDASTFTFLLQDSIGGLYVQKMGKESAWIYVPPISGSV